MIEATRGEHVHVRLRGTKKDMPLGYRIVGYEVDDNGIIGDVLILDGNGSIVKLADLSPTTGCTAARRHGDND